MPSKFLFEGLYQQQIKGK